MSLEKVKLLDLSWVDSLTGRHAGHARSSDSSCLLLLLLLLLSCGDGSELLLLTRRESW